jgi:hypothetical protein
MTGVWFRRPCVACLPPEHTLLNTLACCVIVMNRAVACTCAWPLRSCGTCAERTRAAAHSPPSRPGTSGWWITRAATGASTPTTQHSLLSSPKLSATEVDETPLRLVKNYWGQLQLLSLDAESAGASSSLSRRKPSSRGTAAAPQLHTLLPAVAHPHRPHRPYPSSALLLCASPPLVAQTHRDARDSQQRDARRRSPGEGTRVCSRPARAPRRSQASHLLVPEVARAAQVGECAGPQPIPVHARGVGGSRSATAPRL